MSSKFLRISIGVVLGGMVIFCVWLIHYSARTENFGKDMQVAFLDIGQGDAIFITAPNGVQVLIDGGADRDILSALDSVMSINDKTIDMVVATHPDQDHIGGLVDVLSWYTVDTVLVSGATSDTQTFKKFQEQANLAGRIVTAQRGMRIILDDEQGVFMDIFHPAYDINRVRDTNDASVVAQVVYGNQSFLLTGDASQRIEQELVAHDYQQRLPSDVLKLGHHGSKTSSSQEFLETVHPRSVVISAGCNNRYGHPHGDVMNRVYALQIIPYDTCSQGTIIFETNGETLEIHSQK